MFSLEKKNEVTYLNLVTLTKWSEKEIISVFPMTKKKSNEYLSAFKGEWLVGFEFCGPVNTIKIMSTQSVYLTPLSLGRVSRLSG